MAVERPATFYIVIKLHCERNITVNTTKTTTKIVIAMAFLCTSLIHGACALDEYAYEHQEVYQDTESALANDIAITAMETDLPVEVVEDRILFQREFSDYANELVTRFPDQIAAIWLEGLANSRGHIRFTGEVPSELTLNSEWSGRLNPENVIFARGGVITQRDHMRSAELAADALASNGYTNLVTFFDPPDNVVRVELQLPEESPAPTQSAIASMVKSHVAAALDSGEVRLHGTETSKLLSALDVDLIVIRSAAPVVELTSGGLWMRDGGVRECTSGFVVRGPYGDGVVTAGHCKGLDSLEQVGKPAYKTTFRRQGKPENGDVEYHTTNPPNTSLPNRFYVSATRYRAVDFLEKTHLMVGSAVCMYGRASNSASCNKKVLAVGVSTIHNGKSYRKLARTNNNSSIPGDSGGVWYLSDIAFGIHHGYAPASNNSYFTPVEEAEWAVGVTFKSRR
ncbi:MAG: S1 family peptidase [Proteobacteria bacterium]|nr:S1 family peptidase [Pseudomonadota bacterium]